jgi:hypothetical protein
MSNLISGLGRQLAQIAEQGLVTGEPQTEAPETEDETDSPEEVEAEGETSEG